MARGKSQDYFSGTIGGMLRRRIRKWRGLQAGFNPSQAFQHVVSERSIGQNRVYLCDHVLGCEVILYELGHDCLSGY
jgi:hypothetical protein